MECWLCKFNQTPQARFAQLYMCQNVGCMEPSIMASEISNDLASHLPPNTPGIGASEVLEHINSHNLTPVLRLGTMLRSLLEVSDELRLTMKSYDDGGRPTVCLKTTDAWLKVQANILALYSKGELNRMLFSE